METKKADHDSNTNTSTTSTEEQIPGSEVTTSFNLGPILRLVSTNRPDARVNPRMAMQLQRTIGNRATHQLLQRNPNGQHGVRALINFHKDEQDRSSQTQTSNTNVQIQGGNTSHRVQQHQDEMEGGLGLDTLFDEQEIGTQQTSRLRWQHAHEIAVRQHEMDRLRLTEYLQAGRTHPGDRRLNNSCEWILTGKTKLYALTQTGDTDERIRAHGMNPQNDAAFFPPGDGGGGHVLDAPVDYDWQNPQNDDPNVFLDKGGKSTAGWNDAGLIAITNASEVTRDYVWETIRHEVQHDSDKHRDKEAAAVGDWNKEFEAYKTEYRAYNYEGGKYDAFSDTVIVNRYGFDWTQKQLAIFQGIWRGYDHTKFIWNPTDPNSNAPRSGHNVGVALPGYTLLQTRNIVHALRQKIVAYRNPDAEGFNKWNSVRVDDFYEALKAVPDGTDVGNDPSTWVSTPEQIKVQTLVDKINALDHDDGQYVLNDAPDYTRMLEAKLDDANGTRTWIRNLINAQ